MSVLTTAGCASTPEPAPPSTPAPAPTAAPPTSSSVPPPPTSAADGTNYAACADGTCEVLITAPVRIPFPHGSLQVTAPPTDEVPFRLEYADRYWTGGIGYTCGNVVRFRPPNSIDQLFCQHGIPLPPPVTEPGSVALQVVNRIGGVYIVRIAAA